MTHRRALSGGVERGNNERPGIWSCDMWANERPGNKFHWEGTHTVKSEPHYASVDSLPDADISLVYMELPSVL